jgi:hypothetical protein
MMDIKVISRERKMKIKDESYQTDESDHTRIDRKKLLL